MNEAATPALPPDLTALFPFLAQTQGVMSAFKDRMELLGLQIKQLEDADAQHKAALGVVREDLRNTTKELGDFVGTLKTIHDIVLVSGPNHPSLKELTFYLKRQAEKQEAQVHQFEEQQKRELQAKVAGHEAKDADRSKFWRNTLGAILLTVFSCVLTYILTHNTK